MIAVSNLLYLKCSIEVPVPVQCSVISDSLWPNELQHARPPCPSPTLRVYPNPCPLIYWCHPTFSSSIVPFSSCPQSFPASGSFQMSQLFTSGGQSIGVPFSTSVLPMNWGESNVDHPIFERRGTHCCRAFLWKKGDFTLFTGQCGIEMSIFLPSNPLTFSSL